MLVSEVTWGTDLGLRTNTPLQDLAAFLIYDDQAHHIL